MSANIIVQKITDGLGFGVGSIRHAGISDETASIAAATITSPGIVAEISTENGAQIIDDGCGDGRPVARVFVGNEEHKTSLNRAKVFGGGATMAAAILIGVGRANDKSLARVFDDAIQTLTQNGLSFGDHTDSQAQGGNSGCGAIDKAPLILEAAVEYQHQITHAIATLGVSTEGIDTVFNEFAKYVKHSNAGTYRGKDIIDRIAANKKVIKQLAGEHKEKYIVLNTVPGKTINQAAIRDATHNTVQVFGVDIWRLQEIAAVFPEYGHRALLSELVYTMATAAVLTAGDLPVYVVSEA